MRRSSLAISALVFTAGCSLIDLSSLQDQVSAGGSAATSSAGMPTSTSATGATTTTSGNPTTTTTTSSDSSSSGGCTSNFCDSVSNVDACADFDSAAHTIGMGWDAGIQVFGGTTGTVTTSNADSVSCPSAAVVNMVGAAGNPGNVRLVNSLQTNGQQHIHYHAKVKRTGPGSDGGSVLDVGWTLGANDFCDVFFQFFDGATPFTYVFVQHYDGITATTVNAGNIDLPANTAETWVDVDLEIDFTAASPQVVPSVNGTAFPFALGDPCKSLPATLDAGWGITYSDTSQTVLLDDVTVSSN